MNSPKFKLTPEGAAGLFLVTNFPETATEKNKEVLAELLRLYWFGGYDACQHGEPRPIDGGGPEPWGGCRKCTSVSKEAK